MAKDRKKQDFIDKAGGLLDFIDASPSCYHAVKNIEKELKGYEKLSENEEWKLKAGGRYYVSRNSSSVIAFRIPASFDPKKESGFMISAAHSDSPSLKIKDNGELTVEDKYLKLNVEKYGGMIMAPWFDRPLSIAGRIFVKEEDGIKEILVNIDRDLLIIPNLAIHLNRDINEKGKTDMRTDMQPLLASFSPFGGDVKKGLLNELLGKAAGVGKESILSGDLFLYPRVKGTFLGHDKEMIADRALDDLQCVYSIVKGFVKSGEKKAESGSIPVCCVFDNEETGSLSGQGADSDFLHDVLYRIAGSVMSEEKDAGVSLMRLLADSFMISADNAHAMHPNHPEYADATDRPCLNGGVVVKFNASGKYTTDAYSYARIRDLADRAGVPVQTYSNRPDIAGGSTLGNLSIRHAAVRSVDIGLAQLAMHSCYETAGTYDTGYLIRLMEEYYS